jgi:hypothetical protein
VSIHLDPASSDTFSVDQIRLLNGIPSKLEDGDAQLIVELGEATDGSSTYWTTQSGWTHSAANSTITLAGATTNDVRIRRTTKIDDLWFDSEDLDPNNFSIGVVRLMLTQIVYLSQEAPTLPFFDPTSVLGNTHFPRAWNWLRYVWSGANPRFGGRWYDDPTVIVWKNFIKLTPPTDYELGPWWNLRWPTDPTDGDVIDVLWSNRLFYNLRHDGLLGKLEDPNDPVDGDPLPGEPDDPPPLGDPLPGEPDDPPPLDITGYDLVVEPTHCVAMYTGVATDVMQTTGMIAATNMDGLGNEYTHGLVFELGRVDLSAHTTAHLSLVPALQSAADWASGLAQAWRRGCARQLRHVLHQLRSVRRTGVGYLWCP